jgi:hypothetical protein
MRAKQTVSAASVISILLGVMALAQSPGSQTPPLPTIRPLAAPPPMRSGPMPLNVSIGDSGMPAVFGKATPADIANRMMAFDRNDDRKIDASELSERMQPLIARGDRNGDAALDDDEIQQLMRTPAASAGVRGFPHNGAGYGFADEDSFSTRLHYEGAIDDLRLEPQARSEALAIVLPFVDAITESATTGLLADLESLLTPLQLARVKETIDNPRRGVAIKSADGNAQKIEIAIPVRASVSQIVGSYRLAPESNKLAVEAIERFSRAVKPSEADREALVAELKDVLSDREQDDFRAALERKPIIQNGVLQNGMPMPVTRDVIVNRPLR